MPAALRILLMISSVLSLLFVIRGLKKARVQLYDTVFWIILALMCVILSICPQIAVGLADLLGVQSPVNLVYLVIIFFLLVHCFIQSIRFSRLEAQFKLFVGEDALKKLDNADKEEEG